MDHVCTYVPHLDLVEFGQNVSKLARLMVSCNLVEKNSNCLTLCPITPTFLKMCPISALVIFFHFYIHTLRQSLD